jgi:hypothetical protein
VACIAAGIAANVLMTWLIILRSPHPESAAAGMLNIARPEPFP